MRRESPAGQLTCIKHGGNHPAQRRRGKERLLDMVDPAISQHLRILEPRPSSAKSRTGLPTVSP